MTSKVLTLLASAGAVAAAVAIFIAPKLEDQPNKPLPEPESINAAVEADDTSGRRAAYLSVRNDGHYWARSLVNRKASVDFMVDTGASTVAITQKDAQKMGFILRDLVYDAEIRTAGGLTYGANVTIASIKIGEVEIRNIPGVVMREELSQSLLGMSFLRELYSYEFRGDRLIIRQ